MNVRQLILTLFAIVLSVNSLQAFERYYIVKINGYDGESHYEMKSADDLTAFNKILRVEAR